MLSNRKSIQTNASGSRLCNQKLGIPKKPAIRPLLESEIQRTILDYLRIKGHFPIRINTQGVPMWQGKELLGWRKGPMVGVADILGVTKSGQFFAIEVKRPGGKPTDSQLSFLKEISDHNGIAFVAYDLNDVINKL